MPAYNQYFPQNYQSFNPYQPYANPYQSQPVQPPVMPTSQPAMSTPQSSIIWISGGEAEANAYPVAPNNAVSLWSTTEPVVYLKQADASGRPAMKIYDLVERAQSASNAPMSQDGKLSVYATKDDLSAVVGVVRSFDGAIKEIKAEVDKMSGDMYGVVGKKKTSAKKTTPVEEDEE